MANNENKKKLLTRFADQYGFEAGKVMGVLKQTAFKQGYGKAEVSDEQMLSLLVVAEQYKLNPFLKEIYAYPDKNNGIVPVVGVDGWSRIVNEHPQNNGVDFQYSESMIKPPEGNVPCFEWIECIMYRKDREHPVRVREYLDEVYKVPFKKKGSSYAIKGPWQSHTKRFLRHKAFVQCARMCYGFVGIYDNDEAETIIKDIDGLVVNDSANVPTGKWSANISKPEKLVDKVEEVPETLEVSALLDVKPQAIETGEIDREKLDPLLKKLADRAVAQNAWPRARLYVEQAERFSDAEKQYAYSYLDDVQNNQVVESDHLQAPVQQQSQTHVEIEVPPAPAAEDSFY